jgi:hypothetical protein
MMIQNPHPVGSAAYNAIESRIRQEEKSNSIVGVFKKKGYTSQAELTAATSTYKRSKGK